MSSWRGRSCVSCSARSGRRGRRAGGRRHRGARRSSRSTRPDLVMLDVQMPGLTGFEVARRLLRGRHRLAAGVRHRLRSARDRGVRRQRRRLSAEAGRSRAAGDGRRRVRQPCSQTEPAAAAGANGELDRVLQLLSRSPGTAGNSSPSRSATGSSCIQADEVVHASVEDDVITVVTNSLSGTSNYRTLDELQARLDPRSSGGSTGRTWSTSTRYGRSSPGSAATTS